MKIRGKHSNVSTTYSVLPIMGRLSNQFLSRLIYTEGTI